MTYSNDRAELDAHAETTPMDAVTVNAAAIGSAAARSKHRRRTIVAIAVAAATALAFTAVHTGGTDTSDDTTFGSTWS